MSPTKTARAANNCNSTNPVLARKNKERIERFASAVKQNEWLQIKPELMPGLTLLESAYGQADFAFVPLEVAKWLKCFVRAGDVFDYLSRKEFNWIYFGSEKAFRRIEQALEKKEPVTLAQLELATLYVHIRFRRRQKDFDICEQMLEKIETAAKQFESAAKTGIDAAEAGWRSYFYYYRHLIAKQRQQRDKAEKFLNLADVNADIQVQNDIANAANILRLKTLTISLAKIWLLISRGKYNHAQTLLDSIEPIIEPNDLWAKVRFILAQNVCKRCLAGANQNELIEAKNELKKAILICDKQLGNNRMLLRCYFEKALCYLLLTGNAADKRQKQEYLTKLNGSIAFMTKITNRADDPMWRVQINILRARAQEHLILLEPDKEIEHLEQAARFAEDAVAESEKLPQKLLQIEANICLAVVRLRQKEFERSAFSLKKALSINEEKGLIQDYGEFSQPALRALCFLYLSRISIRQKDENEALRFLREYQQIKPRVEHQWILSKLAPEVEREVKLQFLTNNTLESVESSFEEQMRQLRKVAIEQASLTLGTNKIKPIAEKLQVSRQTLTTWVQELKDVGLEIKLLEDEQKETALTEEQKLRQRKEEIERTSQLLQTNKIAPLARELNISRQTLYQWLRELSEANLAPQLAGDSVANV